VAPEMPGPPCSSEAVRSSHERRAEIEGERLEAGIDHLAVLRRALITVAQTTPAGLSGDERGSGT
jgi:hypothetical protein